MRRRVFYVGLVILVIGIVLLISGSALLSGKLVTGDSFQQVRSDVFATDNLQFNGTTFLLVTNSSTNISLIRTSDMPLAETGNISDYAINSTISISTDRAYEVGAGNYTLVFFGKSAPLVNYEYILQSQEYLASLEVIGIVLAIIGFIIMLIGAFLKEKPKEDDIMKQFENL
ncbi:MAG: hypothetical protein M1431_01715 [Candidatus Thermoplasmatota archaeon]|nr:hypothetical protein [Candidatus Thermoplasmatota archaeon]